MSQKSSVLQVMHSVQLVLNPDSEILNMQINEDLRSVYQGIPGGIELITWIGDVPSFHDGEIVSLSLNRRTSSYLQVTGCLGVKYERDGSVIVEKSVVVTFELLGICYLSLDGFNHQNVIDGLSVKRMPKDREIVPYYDFNSTDSDYEITLDPCYGMEGIIRCNSIAISFKPGAPEDALVKRK